MEKALDIYARLWYYLRNGDIMSLIYVVCGLPVSVQTVDTFNGSRGMTSEIVFNDCLMNHWVPPAYLPILFRKVSNDNK